MYKGKIKVHWGKQTYGCLVLECDSCKNIWKKLVEGSPIAEGMGDKCPKCEKITTNWVLDLLPLYEANIERWF